MDTKVDILVPTNRNSTLLNPVNCTSLRYKTITCIGVYPD